MTIARKGRVLIAIPLIPQIVFLIKLIVLPQEQRRREILEADARTVLIAIAGLERALADSGAGVGAVRLTRARRSTFQFRIIVNE